MKQLFQDILIYSFLTFIRQMNLFNKILWLFFKSCFTFVSDHNTDSLMSYSVQLKNMYICLNSSLKLSGIAHDLSIATRYPDSSSSFFSFYLLHVFSFSIQIMTLMTHKGCYVVKHHTNKTNNIDVYETTI